jgi:predicted nucleotide-binding protein
MAESHEELLEIAERLERLATDAKEPRVEGPLAALEDAANTIGKAWSGSWAGYHSRVYYDGLEPPPSGAHFSQEWGYGTHTTGTWREFDADEVERTIHQLAGRPNLEHASQLARKATKIFDHNRSEVLSLLSTENLDSSDPYLETLRGDVEQLSIPTRSQVLSALGAPAQFISHDRVAIEQGFSIPPHISVLEKVVSLRQPTAACADLSNLARKAGSHISRKRRRKQRTETIGTKVFIGHGRSLIWKDLKDFTQDRLGLPWDEFNRVPIAGITNVARLSEMLDSAAIAFLIMTGEDEQVDGKLHARMNVVHEAGLFQGRLGFTRAIILLEEGCEEFSDIDGLGQIRFPKGNIKAAFEDIRRVLERGNNCS